VFGGRRGEREFGEDWDCRGFSLNSCVVNSFRIHIYHWGENIPVKLTGMTVEPNNSKNPITKRSGNMIQPLKNPFVNLARISSSERPSTSVSERAMVIVFTSAWLFLGFISFIAGDTKVDGERASVSRMLRDLDAGSG